MCPGLPGLCALKDFNSDDSGHSIILYTLHQSMNTHDRFRIIYGGFIKHLYNFGFSTSNQPSSLFAGLQVDKDANSCALRRSSSKTSVLWHMSRAICSLLSKMFQNLQHIERWLSLLQQNTGIYLFFLNQQQTSGCSVSSKVQKSFHQYLMACRFFSIPNQTLNVKCTLFSLENEEEFNHVWCPDCKQHDVRRSSYMRRSNSIYELSFRYSQWTLLLPLLASPTPKL